MATLPLGSAVMAKRTWKGMAKSQSRPNADQSPANPQRESPEAKYRASAAEPCMAANREQTLQFRTDIFNPFNHPSLGQPSDSTVSSNGGRITTPRFTQNLTPDARFFQLSLKYTF